jgi:hypothetical protein
VVCLGRRYAGGRIQACYAVDPRTGIQLELSITLGFSEAEIEAIYDYKMIPDGAIQEAILHNLARSLVTAIPTTAGQPDDTITP